ncbi:MAG: MBL fold metallo-hydrolase [Treponema sp.]
MKPALIQSGPFQVNTWIVPLADSRVLIVDPAACSLSRDETAILSYLNENRLEPAGIFLTHGHFDHITGVRILKDAFPECKIAVHEKDAAMCGSRAAETQGAILGAMGLSYLASAIENLPDADSLFSGGETLDAVFPPRADDDEALRAALKAWLVIHTPGHTQGSACLYNEAEATLIAGDTVFYRSWGRTDLPGGSDAQMMQSLSMLTKTLPPETSVYPGHDAYGFPLGGNFGRDGRLLLSF